MVEHTAVNRGVVGSSPTRGVFSLGVACLYGRVACKDKYEYGSMVKRLRHRPFTAVTGVQIPLESVFSRIISSIIQGDLSPLESLDVDL